MKFPKLKTKIVLAPLAGINDIGFRLICKEMGAGLVYTEMISANALSRGNAATLRLARTCKAERPVSMQLFGQNTESFVACLEYVEKNADVLDINLGCPAQKVIRQGSGCALAKRRAKVKEIVEALTSVSKIPITVKMRAGTSKSVKNAHELAKVCEKAGASAVAVHGRTYTQGYTGKADWKIIKKVKESVGIPVIGNGDVWKPEDSKRLMHETGCDYVMLGRGVMGNPFLIKQCVDYLASRQVKENSVRNQAKIIQKYFSYLTKYDIAEPRIMKSAAQRFTKGYVGGSLVRGKLNAAKSAEEVNDLIKEFF